MEMNQNTDTLIEQLMTATYGDNGSPREKHVFKEALQSLVRLAKAEQMLHMRQDLKKASPVPSQDLHSYWEID